MVTTGKAVVENREDAAPPIVRLSTSDKNGHHAGASAKLEGEETGKRATSTLKQRGMKKYQIVVPESLFDEIEKIADSRQTTVIDIIRRFLKLGLLTARVENTPNAGLFIREGDSEREIILL